MPKRYLLAERTIDETDLKDLIAWLRTGPWLTQGPLCRKFEEKWARWLGTRHAVFVNSGSSANLAMYYAAMLSGRLRSRKVIAPAVSWATTVAPAIQLGLEPVLCEADRETYGLDPDHLERLVKRHRPGAVVLVHVLGVPCRMEPILALQRRYGFLLMEDACAAAGSTYGGRRVGGFGDMSSFSFFFGHHMSTIEGGMVCTDDRKLYELLLMVRAHGWGKDLPPESEARLARRAKVPDFNRPFTFYHPGFNLRSTDLNARIGLSQLRRLDRVVARRVENHLRYRRRMLDSGAFGCQANARAVISSISFAALAKSAGHRARVAKALKAARVETRPLGGGNMSRQPFWASRYGTLRLPMADAIHERCFHLPNHPGLSLEDVDFICDTVLSARE